MVYGITTLQIHSIFSVIPQTLREVPAVQSWGVYGWFSDDCTVPRMNLRITYAAVLQKK